MARVDKNDTEGQRLVRGHHRPLVSVCQTVGRMEGLWVGHRRVRSRGHCALPPSCGGRWVSGTADCVQRERLWTEPTADSERLGL